MIKKGDHVCLKIGGPNMFVQRVYDSRTDGAGLYAGEGDAFCRWIDSLGNPQEAWWPAVQLSTEVRGIRS